MQKTKIALVQMQSQTGDIQQNMDTIIHFTNAASAQNVHMICFPELCIPGYHRTLSPTLAEPIPGRSTQILRQLAVNKKIAILAGLAEQSDTEKPYITQVLALPNGKIETYRKTHLGKSEKPYFTPGEQLPVFATPQATLGLQICWDLHFPEVTAILALQGAEIIFAPHASPAIVGDRRSIWLKYLGARAYDNTVFVAACNLVGDDGKGQSFCGGLLVLDPKGNPLAEDFQGKESILVLELDPSPLHTIKSKEAKSMRNSYYLESRRPELYQRICEPYINHTNKQ